MMGSFRKLPQTEAEDLAVGVGPSLKSKCRVCIEKERGEAEGSPTRVRMDFRACWRPTPNRIAGLFPDTLPDQRVLDDGRG